jgi:hypothetical protein
MRLPRLPAVILFIAAALSAGGARATPRFSLRTGYPCQACHVDPSGGGMRKAMGIQYGEEDLPMPVRSAASGESPISRTLSDWLSIGADFRTTYFAVDRETLATRRHDRTDAFFQMQGDIYLQLSLSKKLSVIVRKGLYPDFDAFAMFSALPWGGSLKAGRFVPNFGTRTDDHTAYVRSMTGFSPERQTIQHTGVEAMISPLGFKMTGGMYNADDGFGSGTSSAKAFLGRAETIIELSRSIHLGLGANIYTRRLADGTSATITGAMAGLSLGDLAFTGEADWLAPGGPASAKQRIVFLEADYPVVEGVDVKIAYDYFDPDDSRLTGILSRYTAGVEFFPLPGVEIRPLYRYGKDTAGNVSSRQAELHLHIYL